MHIRSLVARRSLPALLAGACWLASGAARADAVTEWNARIDDIVTAGNLPNHPATRAYAFAHSAIYESLNALTHRYRVGAIQLQAPAGASPEAAAAAAARAALLQTLPTQRSAIEAAYTVALAGLPDDPSRQAGIDLGERAAAAVLAQRGDDGASTPEQYRPYTLPGVYVTTALPLVPHWPQRKPWLLASASQFRPNPPPTLNSDTWARDFNEVKAYGGRNSARRTSEQTEIARFWEASGPPLYNRMVRSVADAPGRDLTRNARLLAAIAQATDDAYIAIFDAKYHYHFWRPITAIRNGDLDGNEATERDPSWQPFITTPMHPEYPCAHCIIAATVAAVLQLDAGSEALPALSTSSPTANGATRQWATPDALVREVANARVWDGVHFRTSTEVGVEMGRKIGDLAHERIFAR
jgi:PAP2 superfamily